MANRVYVSTNVGHLVEFTCQCLTSRGIGNWPPGLEIVALTVVRGNPYNSGLSIAFGGQMYAVIQTGGKQYRVAPGDTIRIERVSGEVGEQVKFGTVLAVHTDDKKVLAGSDASNASVTGKIVSQGRGKKITVLKFKKTNQYKIQRGHRQNFTAVEVSEIKL